MAMALVSAFKGLSLSPSRDSRVLPAGAVGLPFSVEAAHKKGSGSTKNGRDSQAKRLGVKIFGSEAAKPGAIIVRQRGNKFHAGNNVGIGKDYTLYSLIDGVVKFEPLRPKKQKVSVYPAEEKPPEDPNSRRVKKREHFRAVREKRKAKEEARLARLIELYQTPAKFPEPVLTIASSVSEDQETAAC